MHRFIFGNDHLIFDEVSNSLHLVDELTYEILGEYQGPKGPVSHAATIKRFAGRFEPAAVEETLGELDELAKLGQLFSVETPQPGEEYDGVLRIKALCLHVAHDCNLRCRYCFASTGDFGGGRELMSFETGKAALDMLFAHSGGRQRLEVDFFGGEPLLNFDVVKRLVLYGEQRASLDNHIVNFTLTTNGTNLTPDVTAFLNEHGMAAVLSIDGRPEVHDRMRPYEAGVGSYKHVVPKFLDFIKSRGGLTYYARGTYTKENLDFAADVAHLHELGFETVSVEPVVATADEPYALTDDDLPGIMAEYEKLAVYMRDEAAAGREFKFFHFDLHLDQPVCLSKRLRGCGAGVDYLAVTPTGEVYPCHQFVGREQYRLGTVFTPDELDRRLSRQFFDLNLYAKPGCQDCFARFACSGGCHANADLLNHDLTMPDEFSCQLMRKRLECALWLESQRSHT